MKSLTLKAHLKQQNVIEFATNRTLKVKRIAQHKIVILMNFLWFFVGKKRNVTRF